MGPQLSGHRVTKQSSKLVRFADGQKSTAAQQPAIQSSVTLSRVRRYLKMLVHFHLFVDKAVSIWLNKSLLQSYSNMFTSSYIHF